MLRRESMLLFRHAPIPFNAEPTAMGRRLPSLALRARIAAGETPALLVQETNSGLEELAFRQAAC